MNAMIAPAFNAEPTAPRFTAPSASRLHLELRRLAEPTAWLTFSPDPVHGVHNFTPAVIAEFHAMMERMELTAIDEQGAIAMPPAYAVVRSSDPDYFSQGGDLSFFLDCIQRRDAASLRAYSLQCLDVLVAWTRRFAASTHTISLVQGRALGGGFEMALASDYIVAEEQSTFGFPEIVFGLFPCTGAMGLISSRTNPFLAERMMTQNRKPYSAAELLALGLVDEVVATGEGEAAVERYIAQHARRRKARMKVQQSRQRHGRLDYAEGVQIVEDWVETAMDLDQDELRSLEMLVLMQRGAREAAQRAAA